MKKSVFSLLIMILFLVCGLFLLNSELPGQDQSKISPPLPESINAIVTHSCMPCHSSTGGMMSRARLNFTEWTQYSLEKQSEKVEKVYTVIRKGAMPPKSVRETRPEIIPTKEQIELIKKWADILKAGKE